MKVGRVEDGSIYHYTSASTFLNLIAPYGQLRLSSFSGSIDPREKLAINLGLSVRSGIQEDEGGSWLQHLESLKEMCRDNAHMLCFSNSYEPLFPSRQFDTEGDRGWAHGAMWAHFADRSAGVCLEFDKDAFVHDFKLATAGSAVALAGDVIYMGADDMRIPVPNMSVESVHDATAEKMFAHVVHNCISTFFQKDSCWSYENEFRVAAINSCGKPVFVPIARSLKRVIVGGEFSEQLLPVLEWVVRNAGYDAPVQAIDWFGAFTFPPNPLTGSEDNETAIVPSLSHTRTQSHVHGPDCCPTVATSITQDDQISRWRSMIFRAYRRRLARALEEASAIFGRRFLRDPKFMLSEHHDEVLQLDVDRFIIEADTWSENDPARMQVERFELRFGVSGDSAKREFNLIHIECVGHDGEATLRTWEIRDTDTDSEVLRSLREFDGCINGLLFESFGREFSEKYLLSGVDSLAVGRSVNEESSDENNSHPTSTPPA